MKKDFTITDYIQKDTLNSLAEGILLIDRNYTIVFANKTILQLCGQEREDVIGQKCHKFSHQCPVPCYKKGESVICPHFKVFKTGEPMSVTHTHTLPDGTERIFEITASPVKDEKGNVVQMLEVLRDVTNRKFLEDSLKVLEQEKEIILSSLSELVVYQDTQQRVKWVNRSAAESVGLTPYELTGRYCYEIWHQRSNPCDNCPVLSALKSHQPEEGEISSPDGRMWLIKGYPIKDSKGNIAGIVEVTQNITERKQTEEVLKESEEKFRKLVEHSLVGVYIIQDFVFKYVNPQLAKIFEYSPEELIGKKGPEDLVYPEDWHIVRENLKKRVEGEVESINYTFRGLKKTGEV
ncbi:MAG: PAS domain S-box protein [Nitrospirae bacterium]|nr:PAS domain S-box protein [Nitrospirota bacterium]